MSIFKRIARLFKSNLNDLISKAEDPEKILEQVIQDMREQLRDAQKQVAGAIADEKRLKKQWMDEQKQSSSWESKAMKAVQLGNDELAKEALARKAHHDQLAVEYQKQWEIQSESVSKLKGALQMLNQKIEEAQRKKSLLIARKKRAEAQKMIQDTMSGLADNSAFDTLDRMSKKVDVLEAEAEAQLELNSELQSQTLEEKFRALEGEPDAQEDALAALKAKMGIVPEQEKKASSKVKEKERELELEKVAMSRDEEW